MDYLKIAHARLAGKTLALIGGDRREQQERRIQEAFGLERIIWVETRDSDPSSRRFESLLRSGRVDIIVLMLGLVRHQHARAIRSLCKELSIPLVVCRRTPNPGPLANGVVRATAA